MTNDDKGDEKSVQGSTTIEHLIRSAPTSHLIAVRDPAPEPISIPAKEPAPQVSAPTQHLVPPAEPATPKDK